MNNINQTILVTGGAGYIGSHTAVQLLNLGHQVIIYDNLSNSDRDALSNIKKITGKELVFIEGDVNDRNLLRKCFQAHKIDAVFHFAGLKSVSDSEKDPVNYYDNNVSGSISLLSEMIKFNVGTLIFSSSATVYGDPGYKKFNEVTPLNPINVYGKTKLAVEEILRALKEKNPTLRIAILRYFNPVGAHESGLIGENPKGTPNNLMPFIANVAAGKQPKLSVYGNDWPTPDGTGIRDYIHVDDLARGHIAALNALAIDDSSLITANLGTGRPHSVLEVIKNFENASGQKIPYEIRARRAGDLAEYYADPSFAKSSLNWEATLDIDRMCADSWRWVQLNSK